MRLYLASLAAVALFALGATQPARAQTSYPNDPLFSTQWNLHNTGQGGGTPGADLHALEAWGITKCSSSVTIGILDTGVDPSQPDLKGKVLPGATFIEGTTTSNDDNGHGTQMAGVAAAITNNGAGIAGVCPMGRILPVKVATAGGHTDDAQGDVRVAAGLRWAVDHGANVINFSLGVLDIPAMRDAVDYAYRHNVLVVAASGNSGDNKSPYPGPAYFPHVLAVGGTDNKDHRWPQSSYGMKDLVMAPATDVPATGRGDAYNTGCCTSVAAPQVTGVAALILSVRPGLRVEQLIGAIEKGADPIDGQTGWDPKVGYGRVNAYRSLQIAMKMVSASPGVTSAGGTAMSASFTVSFSSTRAGQGWVLFGSGPGCSGLVQVATRDQSAGTTNHSVVVTGNDLPGVVGNVGVLPGATYNYEVVTLTSAGLEVDNNGGQCYQVTIPSAPQVSG